MISGIHFKRSFYALILVLIIHFSGLIFNCAKKRVASACLSIAKGKILKILPLI